MAGREGARLLRNQVSSAFGLSISTGMESHFLFWAQDNLPQPPVGRVICARA